MRDVAALAGVSTATVSHVINNTRVVSPETAAAVREALLQTGYVDDGVARAMRTGTSRTIGLAMSAISNTYFGEVVHAIEQQLTEQGYSLLLADTHDDPASERQAVADLFRHRPGGIILAPSATPAVTIAAIAERNIPLVCIDRVLPGVDSVGTENRNSLGILVQHLIEIGHTRICMVAGRRGLTTTEERVQGFLTTMRSAGIPVTEESVLDGDSNASTSRSIVSAALTRDPRPTALVVGNNQMTIGSMQALRDAGLSIPSDIALVVFDDFPWSDLFTPRLSAIAQPEQAMAAAAVDLLLKRIKNPSRRASQLRLQPAIHHRESCGCGNEEQMLIRASSKTARTRLPKQ